MLIGPAAGMFYSTVRVIQLALAIVLGALGAVRAEPRVVEVLLMMKDPATLSYLRGLADGISWANAEASSRGGRDIYCPPPTVAITYDQYVSIFTRYAASKKDPDDLAGHAMLKALIDAFPCAKPR